MYKMNFYEIIRLIKDFYNFELNSRACGISGFLAALSICI